MEKLIITLFFEQDWTLLEYTTATEQKQLRPYVDCRIEYDIHNCLYRFYRLNEEGQTIARFLMRKYYRQPDSSHGLAIEKREWIPIAMDDMGSQEIIDCIKDIAPNARVHPERGRHRIEIKDLDSSLRTYENTECPIYVFLKENAKKIREGYFSEIIVW